MPKLFLFVLLLSAFILPPQNDGAHARAGYAKWLKHGDVYVVDGQFGDVNQKFNVQVAWKGTDLSSARL